MQDRELYKCEADPVWQGNRPETYFNEMLSTAYSDGGVNAVRKVFVRYIRDMSGDIKVHLEFINALCHLMNEVEEAVKNNLWSLGYEGKDLRKRIHKNPKYMALHHMWSDGVKFYWEFKDKKLWHTRFSRWEGWI